MFGMILAVGLLSFVAMAAVKSAVIRAVPAPVRVAARRR